MNALHGGRYIRFFWNMLVFMMGVLGSPKLYQKSAYLFEKSTRASVR